MFQNILSEISLTSFEPLPYWWGAVISYKGQLPGSTSLSRTGPFIAMIQGCLHECESHWVLGRVLSWEPENPQDFSVTLCFSLYRSFFPPCTGFLYFSDLFHKIWLPQISLSPLFQSFLDTNALHSNTENSQINKSGSDSQKRSDWFDLSPLSTTEPPGHGMAGSGGHKGDCQGSILWAGQAILRKAKLGRYYSNYPSPWGYFLLENPAHN